MTFGRGGVPASRCLSLALASQFTKKLLEKSLAFLFEDVPRHGHVVIETGIPGEI